HSGDTHIIRSSCGAILVVAVFDAFVSIYRSKPCAGEVSNIIERSPRGASRTDNKCILQHLALDRFLQNPTAGETAVDSPGSISGDEDKRDALGNQAVSHRIDQLAAEIDIEDGGVDILVGDDGKGFGDLVEGAYHLETELCQHVL